MRARRPIAAIAAAVVLVATACSGDEPAAEPDATAETTPATSAPAAADADNGDDGENALADEIQTLVDGFVGDGPGGAVVLVRSGGETARVAAGDADADGTPLAPDRPLRVGSISKPFVATMVMQLVDEGRIALDDTLAVHLPDTPIGGDATIDQLLGHRSGIPNYTDQNAFFTDAFADAERNFSVADVLSYVADVEPGAVESFAYSNTNYLLLGDLIEQLDGTDLNAALERRITGPLGLDDTVFATGDNPTPDGLVGAWSSTAGLDGDLAAPYAAIASGAAGAGALVSTIDDLAAFITALANGELMSDESFAAMSDVADDGYGYGLLRVVLGDAGTGFGHSGGIFGFTSTMAIAENGGDILVIITNADALIADDLAFRIVTR